MCYYAHLFLYLPHKCMYCYQYNDYLRNGIGKAPDFSPRMEEPKKDNNIYCKIYIIYIFSIKWLSTYTIYIIIMVKYTKFKNKC